DRASRKLAAQERARLRHDQVSLEILATKRWRIQVWKRHRYSCHWIDCGKGRRVARLIRPGLKMHSLGGPNANENSQDLDTASPLRHRWIETVTALFDCWEVETGSIGNRLKEVWILSIVIGPRDRRMRSHR